MKLNTLFKETIYVENRRLLMKNRSREENDGEMHLKEWVWRWQLDSSGSKSTPQTYSCGQSNKPSVSINCIEFPLLRRPQEEVVRILRMSTLHILYRLRLFSIALQSGGLSHQLKALVVSKGYHKGIIINTIVNKARRLQMYTNKLER